jgi:hypothetical protein
MQVTAFIVMNARGANFGGNVGGTCKHAANSGQDIGP